MEAAAWQWGEERVRTTVVERQVAGANVSGRKRRVGVFCLRDVSRDAQLRVYMHSAATGRD